MINNSDNNILIIAFYLPQFHPTKNNDIWWGKGFTEWTNVCKAKPLFKGHYQPHIPADLGFYDLRLEETRIAQAEMAKKYGVTGFCYYHYWFGNGKKELHRPFEEVLNSGKPDFPFMLCWANESWHAKFWNNNGIASSKKLLIEQTYGGIEDFEKHFFSVLPAFKDTRYIKINNKPLFMLYKPLEFEGVEIFIKLWNKLAQNNGFDGICFIGQTIEIERTEKEILDKGFNYINTVTHYNALKNRKYIKKVLDKTKNTFFRLPFVIDYKKAIDLFITEYEKKENIIPTLLPNWDHTPRSGRKGYVLHKSSPKAFGAHVKKAMEAIKDKPIESKIIFIKSWNEWGEGNHLEPDLKHGLGYLEELKKNIQ